MFYINICVHHILTVSKSYLSVTLLQEYKVSGSLYECSESSVHTHKFKRLLSDSLTMCLVSTPACGFNGQDINT